MPSYAQAELVPSWTAPSVALRWRSVAGMRLRTGYMYVYRMQYICHCLPFLFARWDMAASNGAFNGLTSWLRILAMLWRLFTSNWVWQKAWRQDLLLRTPKKLWVMSGMKTLRSITVKKRQRWGRSRAFRQTILRTLIFINNPCTIIYNNNRNAKSFNNKNTDLQRVQTSSLPLQKQRWKILAMLWSNK